MIGSSIGANNVDLGKRIKSVTIVIAWVACIIESYIVYFNREGIARLYTNDKEVQAILISTMPLVCLEYVIDGGACILSGPVKALGIQAEAAKMVLASYYIIGLPLGLLCAFKFDMDIVGIWIGNTCGVAFQALTFIYITHQADWQAIADNAQTVMKKFKGD